MKHLRLRHLNRQVQIPIYPRPLPLAPLQPIRQCLPVNAHQLASHLPVMTRTKRFTDAPGKSPP
ncbi:MAG: hypothetical protein LAC69_08425 [Chlorobium sp.]|nr:hypothetical protein [Chlorobium sp.]